MVLVSGFSSFIVDPQLATQVVVSGDEPNYRNRPPWDPSFQLAFERVCSPLEFYNSINGLQSVDANDSFKKAQKDLEIFIQHKIFTHCPEKLVYVYSLATPTHSQTGIIFQIDIGEYGKGNLIPHENTINAKVNSMIDYIKIVKVCNGFPFTFSKFSEELQKLMYDIVSSTKPYIEITKDDVKHCLFLTSDSQTEDIIQQVAKIQQIYIADGHHRIKAYYQFIDELNKSNGTNTYVDDFKFLPLILFPNHPLKILKFNRFITEINGIDDASLMQQLSPWFKLEMAHLPNIINANDSGHTLYDQYLAPQKKGQFFFYFSNSDAWFKAETVGPRSENPMEEIDTWYLTQHFLKEILGLQDVSSSNVIKYLPETAGSIYEAQLYCQKNQYRMIIVCRQASIDDIEKVTKLKNFMPPKSTLFYPKPLQGLLFKSIEKLELASFK